MPNRRMMERMVSSFGDSFRESVRQSQSDKRKKQFRDAIRREYMILTNPDVGEASKKIAYGQLQSMGVTPPARMLQKKVDWTPILKEMSIPESTWGAFRDVDPPDALRLISYLIPDDADTNPLFKFAVSQGWMTQEQADKTMSIGAVEKIAGQKVANQYATQIGILPQIEDLTPEQEWTEVEAIILKDGNLVPYENITTPDKFKLKKFGFSDAVVRDSYNIADKDMTADAILKGRYQAFSETTKMLGMMMAFGRMEVGEFNKRFEDASKLLKSDKLPTVSQGILDYLEKTMAKSQGRDIVKRDLMAMAASYGITMSEVELIIQKLFGK